MTEIEQAIASLKHLVECRCDEAYTGRGRHDPHSACDYADEVRVVTEHIPTLQARVAELTEWDAANRIEALVNRVAELEKYATRLLDDVDDLIAHSRGVSGLHLNDDLAEWGTLTSGGEFEEWLKSLEWMRAALSREGEG